jgi:isopenicillin N synthase-like dioxygenase
MDQAWEASRSFFDRTLDQKLQHKTTNETEYPYGYEQSEQLVKGKQLDSSSSSHNNDDNDDGDDEETTTTTTSTMDWKETFAMGPNNVKSGMPLRRWGPAAPTKKEDDNDNFSNALEQYYASMEELSQILLEIFALALEQPPDFFDDKMDHHMSALRLVHYYPLLTDDDDDDSTDRVRAGAHTDYGAVTILNAKQAGLQVLLGKNSEWYAVPVVPNALIINLGDLMQRWTNGTYSRRARVGKDYNIT